MSSLQNIRHIRLGEATRKMASPKELKFNGEGYRNRIYSNSTGKFRITARTDICVRFKCSAYIMHGAIILAAVVFLGTCGLSEGRVYLRQMSERVVTTRFGQIRGVLVEFPNQYLRPVEAYLGLQYASLLSGSLRFMPPTSPMEKWKNVRVALKHRRVCPQRSLDERELRKTLPDARVEHLKRIAPFIKEQTEDCLTLNLYVPVQDWNETSTMPVMVFIHGETYDSGTGNAYDGSVMASFGRVIVVTINYRLGVLGFLSTGEGTSSGNYAILDQMAALHWLRENIPSFNGDPDRVTLFGHGYGAALVNLLLVSPVTKDGTLFRRAILQSGSALSSWAVSFDPIECTNKLATKVNCSAFLGDTDLLISCLRNKTFMELVYAEPLSPKYYSCFAPAVSPENSVLPLPITELHRKTVSIFRNSELMFGMTKHEAYPYLKQSEMADGITEERKSRIIRTYVHNVFQYHRQKIYEILDHHYTDWDRNIDKRTRRDGILELLSDGQYIAPLTRVGNFHSESNKHTYLYNFGYAPQIENYPRWSGTVLGDELPYVFGAPLVDGVSPFPSKYSKTDKMVSEAVMRYWTNFAKTGNPNKPDGQSSMHGGRVKNRFVNLEWPAYDERDQNYMQIGKRPKIGHHYRGRKLALWLDLIPKLHRPDGAKPEEHLLENADDEDSFDEPDRLLKNIKDIFPVPPPSPPMTPPPRTRKTDSTEPGIYGGEYDGNSTLSSDYFQQLSTPSNVEIASEYSPESEYGPDVSSGSTSARKHANSSVPLSITIAVGCSLLFLNILIFAGIYYQRERIRKIKRTRQQDPVDAKLNRKIEREVARNMGPESVGLLATATPHTASPAHHKDIEDGSNNTPSNTMNSSGGRIPYSNNSLSRPPIPLPVRTPQPPGPYTYPPPAPPKQTMAMQKQHSLGGSGIVGLPNSDSPGTERREMDTRQNIYETQKSSTFRGSGGTGTIQNSTTAV